jgi:hypothetical protein
MMMFIVTLQRRWVFLTVGFELKESPDRLTAVEALPRRLAGSEGKRADAVGWRFRRFSWASRPYQRPR